MANITPQYLRSKIRLDKRISEVANHPQMIATLINTNYLRLSGGAKVDWSGYGNLLYISQPYSEWQNSWFAASKDHRVASPCQITTYIIGIENIYYPNVGYIQVDTTFQRNYVYSPGEGALATPIRDGWALTGVGAHISYNFNGRLLATLWPYYYNQTPPYQEGYMESNWCYFYDFGWDRAYALMIRAVE
jgi:hypothetical protein